MTSVNEMGQPWPDVTLRIYPHRGDAGGAKVVFREEFVARWLAHARGMRTLFGRATSSITTSRMSRHPLRLLEAPSAQAGVLHIRQVDHAVCRWARSRCCRRLACAGPAAVRPIRTLTAMIWTTKASLIWKLQH